MEKPLSGFVRCGGFFLSSEVSEIVAFSVDPYSCLPFVVAHFPDPSAN
jgi:hypothetical protein